MSEFLTSYPRTISVIKGLQDFIHKEEIELNQLSLMVKIKRDEIITALISEGFTRVKLENRKAGDKWVGPTKKTVSPLGKKIKCYFRPNRPITKRKKM